MKDKKDCKIVQDLFPNYIEKLTNEESNQYIEEHLKECDECKKVLESMKKDFRVNNSKRDDREVKYIKKYSKKMKILKLILLAIVLIYMLMVGRRTFIMMSLSNKEKVYVENSNYYVKLHSYQGDRLVITESYNKDGEYLTTMTWLSNDYQKRQLTLYKKGDETVYLSEFGDNKYILENAIGGHILPVTYGSDGFFASLQYALFIGIDSAYCNGRECYVIKGSSYERYVDKETGLAVRSIEKSNKDITRENDTVIDYEYTYNIVKDSDIAKPDTTGFIKK